jgi:hypothetical protein
LEPILSLIEIPPFKIGYNFYAIVKLFGLFSIIEINVFILWRN